MMKGILVQVLIIVVKRTFFHGDDEGTKTLFIINNDIYQQIDGIPMGSPLAPTLADILMTLLEHEIIKTPLITSDTINIHILSKPWTVGSISDHVPRQLSRN